MPQLNAGFGSAYARTDGGCLIVGTGEVERRWVFADGGLKTISMENSLSGKKWSTDSEACDWSIEGFTTSEAKAQLLSITAQRANDDNFSSDYLGVVAEVFYPSSMTTVQYHIWAYPGAPGLRTQLYVKGDGTLANITQQTLKSLSFKTVEGKIVSPYAAGEATAQYYASTIEGNPIEVQILGLDLNKNYKVGLSLWSFTDTDLAQNVAIMSVDSENSKTVLQGVEVPGFKNGEVVAKEVSFDLPTDILLDGSCRLVISGGDKTATVSEIYLYESSDVKYSFSGDIERVEELQATAPEGYVLSGYFDCGEKNGGQQIPYNGYVDRLPVNATSLNRSYVGYFNDTQHRNTAQTPLIRESASAEVVDSETVSWANLVAVDDASGDGIVMLKESHKCVNQYGVDTGDFEVSQTGVYNSGLGLSASEVSADEFKWCWASWSIVYSGDEADRQLAIKRFDRMRYPIDPARDIYIQANTWGSDRSREASREDNVLVELDVQKQLGVDIQQIDDGWQNNNTDWELRSDWYPEGWSRVRAKAEKNGVKMGLWGAAVPIQLEDLIRAYNEGGFISYKLDFASLDNHKNMDELMSKIRSFIEYTGHRVRVNWDLTENAPRYGYYWAREYGCVYLENRKPTMPENVIYVPYLVLRDCWQLNKYTNINKFQTSIQNVDMTHKTKSDAGLHSQAYATAIGLCGVPLLFMETHFLSSESVGVMKNIFARYKEHRDEIFASYCFSVGETPDNESWSGFQYVNGTSGHLLLFRELNNIESVKKIRLEFLKDTNIELTNIMTDERTTLSVDAQGYAEFYMPSSADFRFYHYTIL